MSKQEKVAEPIEIQQKTVRMWNLGSVFWGLLFVLVGTLLLLDNFNIISTNFTHLWRLWPVLIIGFGLSLLSLRGWIGALVSFVTAIALLGLVTLVVVDTPLQTSLQPSSHAQTTIQEDNPGSAKKLRVAVDAGAANIAISSTKEQSGIKATHEGNRSTLKKTSKTNGDTRQVKLSTEFAHSFWLGSTLNNLSLELTQSLPVALTIDTGATNVQGDLSQVHLTSLDVDAGASSVNLRLGTAATQQTINFDAGASTIILHIPKQSGVRVESGGGLTKTSFDGLNKVSDSLYESTDFGSAKKQIIIRTDLGVSKFEIKRY